MDKTLDQLWIKLRPVELLCSSDVAQAAHALAVQTHKAITKGPGDQSIGDLLRPTREELVNVARIDLDAGWPFEKPLPKDVSD